MRRCGTALVGYEKSIRTPVRKRLYPDSDTLKSGQRNENSFTSLRSVFAMTLPSRNLALELVCVTETGAIAVSRRVSRGDNDGAEYAFIKQKFTPTLLSCGRDLGL